MGVIRLRCLPPRPIWAGLCGVALLSCGDGPAGPPPGVPAALTVSPAALTLTAIGQTEQLRAEVVDHYGDAVSGAGVAWTSDRPGTVAVEAGSGLATAVSTGTATVTATAGTLSASALATVTQEPAALDKVAGDLQAGFMGEPLPVRIAVRVRDANGHPAGLARVEFAATSGGGSVAPGSVAADTAGIAEATWTLGAAAEQALTATAGGVRARFQATAEQLALSIATDSLARGRVTLPYLARLRARGGAAGDRVWSLGEGSSLPPGLRFDSTGVLRGSPGATGIFPFHVRVTDAEGAEADRDLSLRVCDAPLELAPGAVRVMEERAIRGCGFHLRAPEAGAYYRVTLVGVNAGNTAIAPVALHVEADAAAGPSATAVAMRLDAREASVAGAFRRAMPASEPRVVGSQPREAQDVGRQLRRIREIERASEALHEEVRRQEEELFARLAAEGRLEVLADRASGAPGEVAAREWGAARVEPSPPTRAFRLYQRTGEGFDRCRVFRALNARLVTETDHIAVYEDAEATNPISKANADRVLAYYEAFGAPVIERYFGGVSDVNGDGRVVVVVNPELGGVNAFVWAGDHTLSREACATSNEMELVHMSAGAFAQLDDNGYWALGGLVHEVKHVSSYHRRVRHSLGVAGAATTAFHPLWIEEGTAEIAKEMSSRLAWAAAGGPAPHARVTGELLRAGMDDAFAEVYGILGLIGRTSSAFAWFEDRPNAITFRPGGRGNIYGSGWHFHRFLRDWFGGAGASTTRDQRFVAALHDSLAVPGVRGMETLTGVAAADLLTRHAIAMSLAGAEDVVPDTVPRFSSYDFTEVGELVSSASNPPGRYPWPVTRTGGSDDEAVLWADFARSRAYRGEITGSGVRFHDFRASEAGAAATFLVELGWAPFAVRVIVARIPDPAGP